MYGFLIDVVIWTFAIFGIINFIQEIGYGFICIIVKFFIESSKKILIKNIQNNIIKR